MSEWRFQAVKHLAANVGVPSRFLAYEALQALRNDTHEWQDAC